MKDLKYEHQSIKVGGWWGGWRVHGVGGGVGGCRVHGVGGCGCVGGGGVHGGVDGWRVHGVGAYTHPPIKGYNVTIFHFMNTHPPTHQTYPKCHSVTINILWMVHGVGGGWWWGGWTDQGMGGYVVGSVVGRFMGWVVVGLVVGGFMGWLCVWLCGWWWGGWLEGS